MRKLNKLELVEEFNLFFNKRDYSTMPEIECTLKKGLDDLLFVNSGMVQFKDVLNKTVTWPYRKVITSQTCLRLSGKHNDLGIIGTSNRHMTNFIMLGHFIFESDPHKDIYQSNKRPNEFIEDLEYPEIIGSNRSDLNRSTKYIALKDVFDFLIDVLEFKMDDLHLTYHGECNSSRMIAQSYLKKYKHTGFTIAEDNNNIWSAGVQSNLVGKSIEIYYKIPGSEKICPIFKRKEKQHIEIWNCVFISHPVDGWENLSELDKTKYPMSVDMLDSGGGLERLIMVINNHNSVFDSYPFSLNNRTGYPRAIINKFIDHINSLLILKYEGIGPGPKAHSYVYRKLCRAMFDSILEKDLIEDQAKLVAIKLKQRILLEVGEEKKAKQEAKEADIDIFDFQDVKEVNTNPIPYVNVRESEGFKALELQKRTLNKKIISADILKESSIPLQYLKALEDNRSNLPFKLMNLSAEKLADLIAQVRSSIVEEYKLFILTIKRTFNVVCKLSCMPRYFQNELFNSLFKTDRIDRIIHDERLFYAWGRKVSPSFLKLSQHSQSWRRKRDYNMLQFTYSCMGVECLYSNPEPFYTFVKFCDTFFMPQKKALIDLSHIDMFVPKTEHTDMNILKKFAAERKPYTELEVDDYLYEARRMAGMFHGMTDIISQTYGAKRETVRLMFRTLATIMMKSGTDEQKQKWFNKIVDKKLP